MAQELRHGTARRAWQWLKWKGLRAVQLLGLGLVLVGAYPYLRPFVATVVTPPEAVDSFVSSFYLGVAVGGSMVPTLKTITFIVVGAVVMWVSTSTRLH